MRVTERQAVIEEIIEWLLSNGDHVVAGRVRREFADELVIKCARCGRRMIAQTAGATVANDAMEICSDCTWQVALSDIPANTLDAAAASIELSSQPIAPSGSVQAISEAAAKAVVKWLHERAEKARRLNSDAPPDVR